MYFVAPKACSGFVFSRFIALSLYKFDKCFAGNDMVSCFTYGNFAFSNVFFVFLCSCISSFESNELNCGLLLWYFLIIFTCFQIKSQIYFCYLSKVILLTCYYFRYM